MLDYRAAYYQGEQGWIVARVLDFPGVNTQGRTLEKARWMLRDALRELAEYLLEEGKGLPTPDPTATDPTALLIEPVQLGIRVRSGDAHVMKRRALLKYLRRHGCVVGREGRGHTIVVNPANGEQTTVPRHTEIDPITTQSICKDLDIPKPAQR